MELFWAVISPSSTSQVKPLGNFARNPIVTILSNCGRWHSRLPMGKAKTSSIYSTTKRKAWKWGFLKFLNVFQEYVKTGLNKEPIKWGKVQTLALHWHWLQNLGIAGCSICSSFSFVQGNPQRTWILWVQGPPYWGLSWASCGLRTGRIGICRRREYLWIFLLPIRTSQCALERLLHLW